MKKITTAIAVTLILGFFAASAYAWGCGSGYGRGMYGNGNNSQAGYNTETYQTFMDETQALRASISADRAEFNALMAGKNPDPQKARNLSEKISRSENELRAKAREYKVAGMGPGMMGPRMMGAGYGWNCALTQ